MCHRRSHPVRAGRAGAPKLRATVVWMAIRQPCSAWQLFRCPSRHDSAPSPDGSALMVSTTLAPPDRHTSWLLAVPAAASCEVAAVGAACTYCRRQFLDNSSGVSLLIPTRPEPLGVRRRGNRALPVCAPACRLVGLGLRWTLTCSIALVHSSSRVTAWRQRWRLQPPPNAGSARSRRAECIRQSGGRHMYHLSLLVEFV